MKQLVMITITLLTSFIGKSQDETLLIKPETNKGKFFVYWGWNRGYYSNSDIHFKGNDYDFTLYDVAAKDRQTKFALDPYFHPERITIPQTNFKAGYFFNEKYNISFGVDHMKYVMVQNQMVPISGAINNGTKFDGEYAGNDVIALTTDFLKFEHTDGLNYINAEINRFDNITRLFEDKFPIDINLTEGVGMGILFPKTNATLMQDNTRDEFHVAGFGLNAKVGLDITFFNHFFFRLEAKGGYINMPDIRTTNDISDKASQQFFFFERNLLIGGRFRISRKKNNPDNS